MSRKVIISLVIISVVLVSFSCGMMESKLQRLNPQYVTEQFLESYKNQDFKTMYKFSHPNIMKLIRAQKLTKKQQEMPDEDLFVLEFETAIKKNPQKKLKSYKIKEIPEYKKGQKIVWARVEINGQTKRLPLVLYKLALKVDLTQLK